MVQYKKFKSDAQLMARKRRRLRGMSFVASVTGRGEIELCGCMGLVIYRDDLMRIRLCDSVIDITGQGLTLKKYFGARMIISGRIDKAEYFECEVCGGI